MFHDLFTLLALGLTSLGGASIAPFTDGLARDQDSTVMVSMRDSVRLETRVILPSGAGPWPALLLRSPYQLGGSDGVVSVFRKFTDEGYALVIQSCRGTAKSEGSLVALAQEFTDGQDAVRWIVAQPWSNHRVGTIGASYEGFTAAAAAIDTPEVQVVIMDGAITRAFAGWPGQRGVPMYSGFLWWLAQVRGAQDPSQDPAYMGAITNARSVLDHDKAAIGKEVQEWRDLAPQLEQSSAYWDERSLVGKLGRLCTPALHIQAAREWDDDPLAGYLDATTDSHCSKASRDAQRFVLGSHDHAGVVYDPFGDTPPGRLLRDYLDHFLKDVDNGAEKTPAILHYLNGADSWRTVSKWPGLRPSNAEYLLAAARGPDGTPQLIPASSSQPTPGKIEYVVDPEQDDPCDPAYSTGATFQSAPLDDNLDLLGRPELQLDISISTPDADLFAALYDVSESGEFSLIHKSRLRLRFRKSYEHPILMTPDSTERVTLELPAVSTRIKAGHSISLSLAGAECGAAENPNTGDSILRATRGRRSITRIFTGAGHASRLRLPLMPGQRRR